MDAIHSTKERLLAHGIKPSAQRVAVADYILSTADHPSADAVHEEVQAHFPAISRATVYNTLNLFVDNGLIRAHVLTEGSTVFDPNTEPHHHLIDEETGTIHDIPFDAIEVRGVQDLRGFSVQDFQVVLRGKSTPA